MKKSGMIAKEISFHILFWLIYVMSEYLANLYHLGQEEDFLFFRATFLSLPLLLLPTYFIVLFAVPRFLKRGKFFLFLLSVLIVGLFVFFARIKWMELINYLDHDYYFKIPPSKVIKNVTRDYSIIALAICIYIIGDWRKNKNLNEQLAKAKAEAEIKLLKGQLHPHFLFNSLNNIYSLSLMKSDQTAEGILKLTELLDYLIYRVNLDKVALSKEVQLLHNYIDLEKLRYGDKLKIRTDFRVLNDSVQLMPLVLLPFAENCFKHGGVGKDGFFWIKMNLEVDDGKLYFYIENSKKARGENKGNNGGIGLQNIRKRLELIYPNRYKLNIHNGGELYAVKLELKLKNGKT